jgi:hypothetical protein
VTKYNPEKWMETTLRVLKEYVEDNVNTRIYNVVMEFPGSIVDAGKLPIPKTIIHFELDAVDSGPVGFGDGKFADNYDAATQTIAPQYATVNVLTFDVGIWASDRSGGTTARMRARQALEFLFGVNGGGLSKLMDYSDNGDGGLEILSFSGGRFVLDSSTRDFRLYRMVDCQLVIRVFSRTPIPVDDPGQPTIEQITQTPNLTIIG